MRAGWRARAISRGRGQQRKCSGVGVLRRQADQLGCVGSHLFLPSRFSSVRTSGRWAKSVIFAATDDIIPVTPLIGFRTNRHSHETCAWSFDAGAPHIICANKHVRNSRLSFFYRGHCLLDEPVPVCSCDLLETPSRARTAIEVLRSPALDGRWQRATHHRQTSRPNGRRFCLEYADQGVARTFR